MHLQNRVVVITGEKRIGPVVAQRLVCRGADLVLSYRGSKTEAEATACGVRRIGRPALIMADVSRAADCEALMSAARTHIGRLDAVVNMDVITGGPIRVDGGRDLS